MRVESGVYIPHELIFSRGTEQDRTNGCVCEYLTRCGPANPTMPVSQQKVQKFSSCSVYKADFLVDLQYMPES